MSSPPKKPRYSINKSKNYYKPNNRRQRQFLEAGQRGFLATCNFREKDCIREAYNVLNHYADELYGAVDASTTPAKPDELAESGVEPGDITDELQREIDEANASKQNAKGVHKHRFQVVDTGANNCVFIRTTLPDPAELGTRIVDDIAQTRAQKTRFLLRLVPVEVVCRANMTDITNAAGALFDRYFLKEGCTFAIVFNKRYNNDVKRDDVIRELAELVQSKNVGNRVDLKQAAKTVVVEIVKGLCCLSVLDNYLGYKKYNLVELANAKKENTQAPATDGQEEAAETLEKADTSKEATDGVDETNSAKTDAQGEQNANAEAT